MILVRKQISVVKYADPLPVIIDRVPLFRDSVFFIFFKRRRVFSSDSFSYRACSSSDIASSNATAVVVSGALPSGSSCSTPSYAFSSAVIVAVPAMPSSGSLCSISSSLFPLLSLTNVTPSLLTLTASFSPVSELKAEKRLPLFSS